MSKILVAYFSASGTTRKLANELAEIIGTDIYEIKSSIPYTSEDLDWTNPKSRSSIEMKDLKTRPEIADKNFGISDYETIFLGFPIWWYVAPHVVNTFLENHNFDGKKIVTFATSGGSGFGETLNQLRPSCSNSVKWIEGKVFRGHLDKETLNDWLGNLTL